MSELLFYRYLKEQFRANDLSKRQLYAFEKRGYQKLHDFADYLIIMLRVGYEETLKI